MRAKMGYSKLALVLLILSILIIITVLYFYLTNQNPASFYGGCDSNGLCF